MYSVILSCVMQGIQCYPVSVEVDVSSGLPGFEMVGMPGGEVKEAKERTRVALKNIGFPMPPKKITVNLSPANLRKNGTSFDLPIAIGVLASMEVIPKEVLEDTLFMGELSLNGELKFISGVLPGTVMARQMGMKTCIVPKCNEMEGASVSGIRVLGFDSLPQIIEFLLSDERERKKRKGPKPDIRKLMQNSGDEEDDFAEVHGQAAAKRAAEIAAAGFHHFMMVGPPGGGKTMIAKRIPSILPPLTLKESLEVSQIYSISGMLSAEHPLILKRPFCAPHHTATEQALIGGGSIPKPGQISLAHRGVLFLDEAPHFSKAALESLRQPMEEKRIEISRTYATYTYPADFMLVIAANPCPCGYFPDRNKCRCTDGEIKRYFAKLSGPIMDRMDLYVSTSAVKLSELNTDTAKEERSESIRQRIAVARQMQKDRFGKAKNSFNGNMSAKEIEKYCILEPQAKVLMEKVYEKLTLGARGYHKILKVARTIADLEQKDVISARHLTEAVGYRFRQTE